MVGIPKWGRNWNGASLSDWVVQVWSAASSACTLHPNRAGNPRVGLRDGQGHSNRSSGTACKVQVFSAAFRGSVSDESADIGRRDRAPYCNRGMGREVDHPIVSAPKYGTSASGSLIEPSACWCCSSTATKRRGRAVPLPLRVWQKRFFPSPSLKRSFMRRAW